MRKVFQSVVGCWLLWTAAFLGLVLERGSAAEYSLGRSTHNPSDDKPLVAGRIYDGSTADRVDEFFRNVPENSTIQLGNHVFETRGVWDNWVGITNKGFRVKKGWTISGKGTNSATGTVLKLVDVLVHKSEFYNHNAVFSTGCIGLYSAGQPTSHRFNVDQVTIRDLQIDCNYPALVKKGKDIQLTGIQLLGNRGIRIENVWIRNCVSRKTGMGMELEGFLVYVYNPWAAARPGDYFIDRVAITEYRGGYVSAICVNGNATGIVQNCSVDLISEASQRYALNFAAGINRFTIRSNIVRNATRGINNDTPPICTNVLITKNQFLECDTGLILQLSRNSHVIGNTISLARKGTGLSVRYHPNLAIVQSGGCVIQDNTFSGPGGEGITLAYCNEVDTSDVRLHWSTGNTIQNNVFIGELQNKIPPQSMATNIVRPGNRRHLVNFPACNNDGRQGNVSAIGFPSDIGPGADCSYCEARAVESSYGFISRVRLRGTGIDMPSDWGDGSGYSDFTTGYPAGVGATKRQRAYLVQWADLRRGRSYEMDVDSSALSSRRPATFHVYIDLDHDGAFQRPGELVARASSRSSVKLKIPIPATAALGSTRMRVIMAGGRPPNPCDTNSFWGEVEDYTVSIMP